MLRPELRARPFLEASAAAARNKSPRGHDSCVARDEIEATKEGEHGEQSQDGILDNKADRDAPGKADRPSRRPQHRAQTHLHCSDEALRRPGVRREHPRHLKSVSGGYCFSMPASL